MIEKLGIGDDYDVDRYGNVFSLKSGKLKMLTQFQDVYGYMKVRLKVGEKRKDFTVHKLVAYKYLGGPPIGKDQIRHLDGNKKNNCISNLAWGTAKENADDRELHGNTCRGERHGKTIISKEQVLQIKNMLKEKIMATHISKALGVNVLTIYDIKYGRTWKHITAPASHGKR
jgi:hypothetical protein